MIEIEHVWHEEVKKITEMINTCHAIHDQQGVEKEISKLIGFFQMKIPKKKKEEKKLYFIQWSAHQVLIKIAKNHPDYLYNFKKEFTWLSRNPNKNIYERARELIDILDLKYDNKKCIYLQLDDFWKIMGDNDKLEISTFANHLELSIDEALDWLKQLIERKYINAYISNNAVHIIK
ncbi:MAG: hypothetical protein ACTSPY_07015 [Candidatus Helarchaeota archaeon]